MSVDCMQMSLILWRLIALLHIRLSEPSVNLADNATLLPKTTHILFSPGAAKLPVIAIYLGSTALRYLHQPAQSTLAVPNSLKAVVATLKFERACTPLTCVSQIHINLAKADYFVLGKQWRLAAIEVALARRRALREFECGTREIAAAWCSHLDSYLALIALQTGALHLAESAFCRAERWLKLALCTSHRTDSKLVHTVRQSVVPAMAVGATHIAWCFPRRLVTPALQLGLNELMHNNFAKAAHNFCLASHVRQHILWLESAHETGTQLRASNSSSEACNVVLAHHEPNDVEAMNNLALSSLYSCKVTMAVRLLEKLIQCTLDIELKRVVAFNLCTLYDLTNDAEAADEHKKSLHELAGYATSHLTAQ